jgi:hypothetical protein
MARQGLRSDFSDSTCGSNPPVDAWCHPGRRGLSRDARVRRGSAIVDTETGPFLMFRTVRSTRRAPDRAVAQRGVWARQRRARGQGRRVDRFLRGRAPVSLGCVLGRRLHRTGRRGVFGQTVSTPESTSPVAATAGGGTSFVKETRIWTRGEPRLLRRVPEHRAPRRFPPSRRRSATDPDPLDSVNPCSVLKSTCVVGKDCSPSPGDSECILGVTAIGDVPPVPPSTTRGSVITAASFNLQVASNLTAALPDPTDRVVTLVTTLGSPSTASSRGPIRLIQSCARGGRGASALLHRLPHGHGGPRGGDRSEPRRHDQP